jgi:prevent-host-death family protein
MTREMRAAQRGVGSVARVERISTVKARNSFSRIINRVSYGHERVMLTCRGYPMAAVVSVYDLMRLVRAEELYPLPDRGLSLSQAGDPAESTTEAGARLAAALRHELHQLEKRDRLA